MRDGRRVPARGACLASFALAVCGVASSIPPAAASSISGGGEFDGTVSLELFPCPSSCIATFTASFRGMVGGTNTAGQPYTVVFPDPTTVPPLPSANLLTSGVTYNDVCGAVTYAPAAFAGSGSGGGSFQVSGGELIQGSVVSHGASLKGSFFWSRLGPAATVGISAGIVSDGSSSLVASGLLGAGPATFSVPTADLMASCDAKVSNITATIQGAAVNFA
jgi:hypothetical protein